MTRDAEHTPSPQSVVVPVEPLTEMRAAAGYLRNAKIDLETGAPKATAIRTIEGGLKRLEGAIDAFADDGKAIKAAPAPSSLAGGEVTEALDEALIYIEQLGENIERNDLDMHLDVVERPFSFAQTMRGRFPSLCAALSPEAPAREGGWIEAAKRPDTTGDLWLAVDAAGKLFPGVFVNHRIPTEAALVQRIMLPGRDALTPRHEAPASEGDAS